MKFAHLSLVSFAAVAMAASSNAITIAEAKAGGVGQTVSLTNVVVHSVTDLISSGSLKSFYLQDATGGITVFGSNADIDGLLGSVSVGDSIDITGDTDSFRGLFELVAAFNLDNVNSSGNTVNVTTVTPVDFMEDSSTAEVLESQLVKAMSVTFDDAGGTFSTGNYIARDASGNQFTVRVATSDLDIIGTTIASGPVNVTGVFSQFDSTQPETGGYQLLVRGASDIEAVPEPATMAILGLGIAALARQKRK